MWLGPQKGSYELQRYQSGQHGATLPARLAIKRC